MKTLLAIIATDKDTALLARHWPYFKMLKWDILGCGPETSSGRRVTWPDTDMCCLDTGKMGTRQTPAGSSIFGLVEQELDIMRWFLSDTDYDSLCVVEADNLFVSVPPDHPGDGLYLVTQMPNYSPRGLFKTPFYFSSPRWGDRACIETMHAHGRGMFEAGDVEWWISDRFPAWVAHQAGVRWLGQPAWSPSALTRDDADWVRQARAAIKMGVYCLHSVKHQWQLDALADLLPKL